MHHGFMSMENTLLIRFARTPTAVDWLFNDFHDHSVLKLDLQSFSPEEQQFIREQVGDPPEDVPWTLRDLAGEPIYPSREQRASTEGWLEFFQVAQGVQQALSQQKQQELEKNLAELQEDLEHWEGLDDDGLLEEAMEVEGGLRLYRDQAWVTDVHQGQLEARLFGLTEARFRERDRLNRAWVQQHGSVTLQQQVAAFSGLLVSEMYELDFVNEHCMRIGLMQSREPYKSFLLERFALEHPGATFSPYLLWEEHPNPTDAEVQKARELGGQLVWLDTYPDLLDEEDPRENVLDFLFEGPVGAVVVPFPAGNAVYFLTEQPQPEAGKVHVLLWVDLGGSERVLVQHDWRATLRGIQVGEVEQQLSLSGRTVSGEPVEVHLHLDTSPSGEVIQGHYTVVREEKGQMVAQFSSVLTAQELQKEFQEVNLVVPAWV